MATRLFVTGGRGFVGSGLLARLAERGHRVVALDRSGSLERDLRQMGDVRVVSGDLLESETYRAALATTDIVLHLAASTGRASREEHFRINAVGTEVLLAECHRAGVQKFLFVSSIAAKFPDTRHYHYAQAKIRAESAVRQSGLRFAILRPTMILGGRSPILSAFEKLAMMPVIPIFGNGRTSVQPIHVDDVVEYILTVLDRDMFTNEIFEIGGPRAVTIEALLQAIRQARKGRSGGIVHLPLGIIVPPIAAAEGLGLGRLLPFSVGQLATFRFDGTAATNLLQESGNDLRDIPQMLERGADQAGRAILDRECRVFTKHVLGCPPDAYVTRKYVEAHLVSTAFGAASRFDAFLLGFARRHHLFARTADSYASLFFPGAVLRKKLVLLLAILETSPPYYRTIDQAPGEGRTLLVRLSIRAGVAMLCTLLGALIFVPTRLIFAVVDRRPNG